MNRKTKILKKKRLKQILSGKYETLNIDDKYLIATYDYDNKQLNSIISESCEKPPLWDWFTLVNKKKNKIWYVDFSAPYIWDDFFNLKITEQKEIICNYWSIQEIPINFKHQSIKGGMFIMKHNDELYEQKLLEKKEFYLNNNNWDKTIEKIKEQNDFNKKWNQGIQIYKGEDKHNIGIIIPHDFTNKTFLEVFTEAIKLFNQSKYNDKFFKLIEEIQYQKFLY